MNVLMQLVFVQGICNGTGVAINLTVVKITLSIEAIVAFVKLSIPIALMTFRKLNIIQSNFLNYLVNSSKMLNFAMN